MQMRKAKRGWKFMSAKNGKWCCCTKKVHGHESRVTWSSYMHVNFTPSKSKNSTLEACSNTWTEEETHSVYSILRASKKCPLLFYFILYIFGFLFTLSLPPKVKTIYITIFFLMTMGTWTRWVRAKRCPSLL